MISKKHTLAATAIMLLTLLGLKGLNHSETIVSNRPFSEFPQRIGQWQGETSRFDEKVYEILGVDDSILSSYRAGDGRQVQLYVGFYQSQREGDLIHSPKNCMPGAGWNIVETSLEEVETPGVGDGRLTAIKLILKNGPARQVVLYWFQSRGRIIASEYWQKIYLVIDSVTKRRTDGSFVRLISPVVEGDEAKTLEALKAFTRELVPVLKDFIPA